MCAICMIVSRFAQNTQPKLPDVYMSSASKEYREWLVMKKYHTLKPFVLSRVTFVNLESYYKYD